MGFINISFLQISFDFKTDTNTNRSNITTPSIKSVLKFQNELKYKQILRDHEVKITELQQQLDELAKYNEELELKFESSD